MSDQEFEKWLHKELKEEVHESNSYKGLCELWFKMGARAAHAKDLEMIRELIFCLSYFVPSKEHGNICYWHETNEEWVCKCGLSAFNEKAEKTLSKAKKYIGDE